MPEVLRFHFDNLQVTVDRRSYLVEVCESRESGAEDQNIYSEMPDWVFRSKHAIWLAERGATVTERALNGEAIKSQIWQHLQACR